MVAEPSVVLPTLAIVCLHRIGMTGMDLPVGGDVNNFGSRADQ
ncbi:MAG: hypothetical protein WBD20_18550 [Pirellulaceae bacterium]